MNGTPHENVDELDRRCAELEARCEKNEKDIADLRKAYNAKHVESKKPEKKHGK